MNDASRPALPAESEVIVVGGGTAGAAVAARLVEAGREVLVLEAGPDPGPLGSPEWPADLVDATRLGTSLDWGFDSGATYPDQVIRFERSRVIGGCSAHNGAVQTWGHRLDYDGWAAYAGPGWTTDELLPYFERATEQLRVHTYERADLTPWQEAWLGAWVEAGVPLLDDVNGLDETVGVAPESVNIVDGVRFNSAFAYLDPLREDPRLTIAGDALVDRLILAGDRVAGVVAISGGVPVEVRSPLVILCGGTFCTPAVLLRSGIGPAADLRALGIEVAVNSPGVGANLHDQPFLLMSWEVSAAMEQAMADRAAGGWAPDEMVMAKLASSFDPDCFDLHVLPYSPTHLFDGRSFHAGAGCLLPRSRGTVKLAGADPEALPPRRPRLLLRPRGPRPGRARGGRRDDARAGGDAGAARPARRREGSRAGRLRDGGGDRRPPPRPPGQLLAPGRHREDGPRVRPDRGRRPSRRRARRRGLPGRRLLADAMDLARDHRDARRRDRRTGGRLRPRGVGMTARFETSTMTKKGTTQ